MVGSVSLSHEVFKLHVFTVKTNGIRFEEINFTAFEDRDLSHRELFEEFGITILMEIEGLFIKGQTVVSSLQSHILISLFFQTEGPFP